MAARMDAAARCSLKRSLLLFVLLTLVLVLDCNVEAYLVYNRHDLLRIEACHRNVVVLLSCSWTIKNLES